MENVKSWDDWFRQCGERASDVKDYEDEVFALLDKIYPKEKDIKDRILFNPLNKNFYEKDVKSYNKKFISGKLLLGSFIIFILTLLDNCIAKGIISVKNTGEGIEAFFSGFPRGLLWGVIWGILFAIIFIILANGIKIFSMQSRINKLNAKANKLEDFIKLVPPKYRNYEALTFISALFFEYPYVTFSQAIDNCDAFMRENRTRNIKGILYDVPYGTLSLDNSPNPLYSQQSSNTESAEDASEISSNPNLPADISSKKVMGSDDAQKDLNAMIGLESVKSQIDRLKNRIQFYGADSGNSGNHMVFMGSAGTGKSVTARIITKILYDFGYISKNQCVEIDGDYLKSPYVGQTGERTSAIVDYAMGGVLFIDEAYLLYDKNSASAEATGVLLKAMEDRRKDFVVILAGYEEQMTKLLASNEGFASRIKHKITFPDYTVDEMYQIFNLFLNNYRPNTVYIIEDDAKALLLENFKLEKRSKSFGNARTVRNAVDYIMEYHADRMVSEQRKSDTNQITIDDVKPYFDLRNKELKQDIRNSSAGNLVDESIIRLADLKVRMKEGSSEPEVEIRGLVGLDTIKEQLDSIAKEKEFYGEVNSQLNFTFNGADDTVKSKVAGLLTGFLYKLGYIRENRYLDISAEFLKGSYVGHTSRRVEAILNYATGGILYIRNIGLLSNAQSSDTFAQEALSVISSSNVEDLTIIIDDTSEKIAQLLSMNPDMKNKISHNFVFPDYTPNQQLQIFTGIAKQSGFVIEESCLKLIQDYFEKQMKPSAQFVFDYFSEIKRKHINNYSGEENKFILSMSDFDFNIPPQPKRFKLNIGGNNT